MSFWSKTDEKSIKDLNDDVLTLLRRVEILDSRVENIRGQLNSLRGKVYQQMQEEEEEEEPRRIKKDLNKPFSPFGI